MVDYREYLDSEEWKEKRKLVIERCSNICEDCKCYPIESVHHLTYERLGNERLEDLLGLCDECHLRRHPDKEIMKNATKKNMKVLTEVADICNLPLGQLKFFLHGLGLLDYETKGSIGNSRKVSSATWKANDIISYSRKTNRDLWDVEAIKGLLKFHNIERVEVDRSKLPDFMQEEPKKVIYNRFLEKYGMATRFNVRKRFWEIKKNNRKVATYNSTDKVLLYRGNSYDCKTFEEAVGIITKPKEK